MFDIVSIGDATLDVFLRVDEAKVSCELDTDRCIICFNYADKIPVDSVIKVPGAGNASNNAVGSSRLGLKTAMFGILGDDDVGEQILKHWKSEGVDVRHVVFDKKRGTNYSTVLNYHGERTILVFHEKRDYRFPVKLERSKWVYYTSLGEGSEVLHDPLLAFVKRTGAKLAFQPGTFQLKLGKERLRKLIDASEMTVMNKEEAQRLVGNDVKDVKELLKRLHDVGCRIAVITDGPNGSTTYDGNKFLRLGIFDAPVIERTGVGDAYATAFVAALHHGKTIAEAMRWGTANSASVVGYIGPQAGLLTKNGLAAMLRKYKDVHPQEF